MSKSLRLIWPLQLIDMILYVLLGKDLERGKKDAFKIKTPPKTKLLFIKYEIKVKKLPEK